MKSALSAAAAVLLAGTVAIADPVAFDQFTFVPGTQWSAPSSAGAPTGTGNRQMGQAVTLATGTNAITGFDLAVVNATGAPISNAAGSRLRLNYWIWNTVTPGASTTTAAFSNIATSASVEADLSLLSGPFATGTLLFFANGASQGPGLTPLAGLTPGVSFAPVTITSSTVGLAFSWDLSTDNGTTWTSPNNLTTLITGGASTGAPSAGSNPTIGAPVGGYYRSPNLAGAVDGNGNFAQGSARQIGNNSGLVLRVYSVPTPASAALLGLGGLVAARRRRA
jgi:hypothetical protein